MVTEFPDRPPILSRPYSERQMIVVTEDEVADALYRAERLASAQTEFSGEALTFGARVSEIAIRILFPSATLARFAVEVVKALKRAHESGIPIRHVGKSEAITLAFPPGHPKDTVVYIGHPAIPEIYYTIADFHRVTFQHKFTEAIRLLMYLGASQVRVEHVHGWSKEFSSRLSVPLARASASVDGHTEVEQESQVKLLYIAEFSSVHEPKLPDSLVWYQHEPTWQLIAEGRLKFGLKRFSLNVVYEDDYGIHAGLRTIALKAGFDLGGNFEDHEATTWRISGRFRGDD